MHTNEAIEALKIKALSLIEARVEVPDSYEYKSCLLLNHDAIPVFVFRYERQNGINSGYGGEYFSVSVDLDATKIMGFMHVDKSHCGPGLPDDDSAKQSAVDAIKRLAPDLDGQYEIKWVLSLKEEPEKIPHESPFPFTDESGVTQLVTGVRVKLFFNQLNSWGWVIVGRDGKLVAFEREVNWNTVMNRRSTPAWLHDPFVQDLFTDLQANIQAG